MSVSGVISRNLTPLYICNDKNGCIINKMRFNNSAAYNLSLQLYNAQSQHNTDLYNLILDAGDTVTDNMEYKLNYGDKVLASSSTGKTFYTISFK